MSRKAARRDSGTVIDAMVDAIAHIEPRKRRGRRPNAERGGKPLFMLIRAMRMLMHFEQARKSGLGHTAAIAETVKLVKRDEPEMKGISRAEVERVLHEFQPDGAPYVWRVRPFGNGGALYSGPRWRPRRII